MQVWSELRALSRSERAITIAALALAAGVIAALVLLALLWRTGAAPWLAGALALLSLAAAALAVWTIRSVRDFRAAHAATLLHARESAKAAKLAKSRFLSVASHDMRQPLHALSLYLSALDRRIEDDETRTILGKMERATDSMIAMFAALLDLARVQAGVVHAEFSTVALQDLFEKLAREHPDGAVEAPATTLAIKSDPLLIERALRNLIANAVKHGGGKARLSARAEGDRAVITVADGGPGIAAEDQERIFEEFVRLDTRGRGDGLGLGLAVVKGVAEALDMPLDVESAPGAGARFILRPLRSTDAAPAEDAERASLAGAAALVVDDDALARSAVARTLKDLGAEVRVAGNESEAAALIQQGFAPRILVMDLRIDGNLRGIDIARALNARMRTPAHVIIVTGDAAPETLAQLRESGFAWMIKPVNPGELSRAVAQLAA